MRKLTLNPLLYICALVVCFWGCESDESIANLDDSQATIARATVSSVISLKGSNGLYVSGEQGTQAMRCNRNSITSLEKFSLLDEGSGKVSLRSKGMYVSSENGAKSMNCNRVSVGGWELFTMIQNSDGTVSFKGSNGQYVSSENGNSAMNCNRSSIQGWEKFQLVVHSGTPPTGGGGGDPDPGSGGTWRQANLTNFTSYPDPNSDECLNYNGCLWAGQFAFVDGKKSESWVRDHNIIAIHSRDAGTYNLKTFRLRQGTKQIDAVVYDMCSDSDCNGCCTQNASETGFLIDIEKYTMQRFGSGDGIVEWQCLDCN